MVGILFELGVDGAPILSVGRAVARDAQRIEPKLVNVSSRSRPHVAVPAIAEAKTVLARARGNSGHLRRRARTRELSLALSRLPRWHAASSVPWRSRAWGSGART